MQSGKYLRRLGTQRTVRLRPDNRVTSTAPFTSVDDVGERLGAQGVVQGNRYHGVGVAGHFTDNPLSNTQHRLAKNIWFCTFRHTGTIPSFSILDVFKTRLRILWDLH